MKPIIIISISLLTNLFIPENTQAQTNEEILEQIQRPAHSQNNAYKGTLKESNSEYELVFNSLFVFYKRFISSQDASSCGFTPSCSEYAIQAIQKQGVWVGLLNFWDRFSRCNGMSPENYEIDQEKKLQIDPVRDWHYDKK